MVWLNLILKKGLLKISDTRQNQRIQCRAIIYLLLSLTRTITYGYVPKTAAFAFGMPKPAILLPTGTMSWTIPVLMVIPLSLFAETTRAICGWVPLAAE